MVTAKAYLSQAMRMEARIRALEERRGKYAGMAARADQRSKECACRFEELTMEIDRQMADYAENVRRIGAVIGDVEDQRYRDILTFRYLNGWNWRRIADIMNYEISWVYRLHSKALDSVAVPESNGQKQRKGAS